MKNLVLFKVTGYSHLLYKIVFGGVIIALANKSIATHSFTILSVPVMIFSLNDY